MNQFVERNVVLLVVIISLSTTKHVCDSFTTFPGVRTSSINRISLGMSKNSDRARHERDFEDMMGDDWRVFRAKLIDQEKREAAGGTRGDVFESENSWTNDHIDSIGRKFTRPNERRQQPSSHIPTEDFIQQYNEYSIFNGDNIGGAGDPFATEEEKVAANARRMNFDKHRWAHPISHIETGCVLVANEKLGGVFHQTVILIVNHNEKTGTTGVCINRPLPGDLVQVASETMSNIDQNLKMTFNEASVSYGGPVMEADYSVLHGYGEVEGSKKVAPGVFVGGSRELMGCLEEKNVKQSEVLFVKGHAAWIPSQIEREVSKGVWYIASVSPDFILRYAGDRKSVV